LIGGAALEMEACWPSGVVLRGKAPNHPVLRWAEDRRGERQGRIAARMREVGLRLHPDIETLEGVLGCTIQEALATYSGRDGWGTQWAPGPEIASQNRGQQGRRDTV
jgi:hypothetical protein